MASRNVGSDRWADQEPLSGDVDWGDGTPRFLTSFARLLVFTLVAGFALGVITLAITLWGVGTIDRWVS